ncbi:MAG: hypothetical protein WC602_02185 [archaeon]
MELFRIPEGPWQKVFEGNFQGHHTVLFSNGVSTFLSVVGDNDEETPNGVLLEFFNVFKAEGNAEAFVETLPRDVRMITRHTQKKTSKFFFLASDSAYAAFNEDDVFREADTLLKKLSKVTGLIKEISKAYGITLRELKELSEGEKLELFSEPLMMGILGPMPLMESGEAPSVLKGEVMLGVTQEQKPAREPLAYFRRTIIFGPDERQRKHAMHIIAEGALLSNTPAVIVDFDDSFSGLPEASAQLSELKKYKVETEPIGFPVKQFKLGEDFFVELGKVNPKGLMELYGAGESASAKIIENALEQKKAITMQQLVAVVKGTALAEEFSEYQKNCALRIIALIDKSYPDCFGGKNEVGEISKNWIKGIGRAGIIRLKGRDKRIALMALHTIAIGLLEYYREKGKSGGIRSVFIVPKSMDFLPIEAKGVFSEEIAKAIVEGSEFGLASVLEAEKEVDLDKTLTENLSAEITLVQDNDAGVRLEGKRQYRAFIRPSLSRCAESY